MKIPDIIVFSHLRWEFVKQRPQHLMERLAKENRVVFVEEPIANGDDGCGTAHIIDVNDNLMVVQPRVDWGDFKDLSEVVTLHSQLSTSTPIVWLYSASFVPVLEYLDYSLLVYDCMDELAAFKGAPKELITQEKELLAIADVVFTGGKSLYQSKKRSNPNTYCLPSSVDKIHFQKAFAKSTSIPADIAVCKKPVVGFYGVIDERMDLDLLAEVAKMTPEVDFVLIGPVVKIDNGDLPVADNIRYLGAKHYDELPNYLNAFKIAMMPFALNESTKFISPTKTLEFMAARKPIISTPIYDVKRDYSREVQIVRTAAQFSQAIKRYLGETPKERQQRIALQTAVIDRTSWDKTAKVMRKHIYKALKENEAWRSSIAHNLIRPTFSVNLQLAQGGMYGSR